MDHFPKQVQAGPTLCLSADIRHGIRIPRFCAGTYGYQLCKGKRGQGLASEGTGFDRHDAITGNLTAFGL